MWYSIRYRTPSKDKRGRPVTHSHHVKADSIDRARRWWNRNYKTLPITSIRRINVSHREPGEFTILS